MFTIKDISYQFGLPDKFLRRCLIALKEELEPFTKRGEHNSILFDTASSGIFEQIRIHKETGLSIPEIVKIIKNNLGDNQFTVSLGKVGKQEDETLANHLGNDLVNRLLESEKARYNAELRVFHAEKTEMENRLRRYENDIKLLTDGTTTDMSSYLKKKAEIEVERKYIIDELKNTKFWMFRKKKELLNKLESL